MTTRPSKGGESWKRNIPTISITRSNDKGGRTFRRVQISSIKERQEKEGEKTVIMGRGGEGTN